MSDITTMDSDALDKKHAVKHCFQRMARPLSPGTTQQPVKAVVRSIKT